MNVSKKNRTKAAMERGRPIRVAAYIRVSTDAADQENSYETQERYFQRLLTQHEGWVSGGIYADYGISGTNQKKRTGFQRILRHCREGKIDRIVCKSISRFARNTSDFMLALSTLRESGATIFFEKENLDTADLNSEFIFTTLGAIAQEESRSISENTSWGIRKRYMSGEARNVRLYGYRFPQEPPVFSSNRGYRIRKLEIEEKEAKIVRRIFQEAARGEDCRMIARRLNYEKIPSPQFYCTRRQKRKREGLSPIKGELRYELDYGWTSRMIRDLLRLERYAGDVLLQKTYTSNYLTHQVKRNRGELEQYLVRNHHPAIISRELFDKVQPLLTNNSRTYETRGGKVVYPFSRRLICAHCGRFYHVRNTHRNPIWFCPSAALNNGKAVCHAGKLYGAQIVRMFRKAVIDRYHLTLVSIGDDVSTADLISGHYIEERAPAEFTGEADLFVWKMLRRLETVQQMDYMERDRSFLKRRMAALQLQQRTMKNTGAEAELKKREERLAQQLCDLEEYWEELEADYECRERTIAWMRRLPGGKAGLIAFLNGMEEEYVKAFVISVIIESPFRFTVHWFDDTKTVVEMDSNIESIRRQSV